MLMCNWNLYRVLPQKYMVSADHNYTDWWCLITEYLLQSGVKNFCPGRWLNPQSKVSVLSQVPMTSCWIIRSIQVTFSFHASQYFTLMFYFYHILAKLISRKVDTRYFIPTPFFVDDSISVVVILAPPISCANSLISLIGHNADPSHS